MAIVDTQDSIGPFSKWIIKYYISECQIDDTTSTVGVIQKAFDLGWIAVENKAAEGAELIKQQIKVTSSDLSVKCGNTDSFFDDLTDEFCSLEAAYWDSYDLVSCRTFQSIWGSFAHEAVCYHGTKSFAWIGLTQFLLIFVTLIMMTLRAGFSVLEKDETDQNELGDVIVKVDCDDYPGDEDIGNVAINRDSSHSRSGDASVGNTSAQTEETSKHESPTDIPQ
jgi:hypothetical protein